MEHMKPSIDPGFFNTELGMEAANASMELNNVARMVEAGRCSYIEKVERVEESWVASVCRNKAEHYLIFNGTVRSFCPTCYGEKYVDKVGQRIISREEAIICLVMQS